MDVIDQVDHVPKYIAAGRIVPKIAKDRGHDIATLPSFAAAAQASHVGEQPRTSCAITPNRPLAIDEGERIGSGNSSGVGSPIDATDMADR